MPDPGSRSAPGSAARASLALAHERVALDNGLTVIFHEDHSLPVAGLNLWYQVGSKDEEPGRTGFAHLFEHLMFMGTERVPGSEFDRLMEQGGGANNATTSFDRTNYFSSGPAELLPTLLWLEADRLEGLGAAMTQEKLDRQREVVRNERRQSYENRPCGRADLAINEALFPEGHPYHVAVIGSHEDLQAATVEDVRRFFDTFYVASNASLVVAGDFDRARIEPLIHEWFGTLPSRRKPARKGAEPVRRTALERLAFTDDVQLPRLTLAWTSPALHEDGDADLDVLAGVLAEGRSSRLWRRLVRDERLCADVGAIQASRQLASVFEIEASCVPGADLARIEAIVEEELLALQRSGPTAREIERIVQRMEHAALRRLESLMDRADQLNAYHVLRGQPDSLAWDLARHRAVTPETARDWASRALPVGARLVARVVKENPRDRRPAPAPQSSFDLPAAQEVATTGPRLQLVARRELPLVALRLVFPAGAGADGADRAGLAQLALDAADEGTRTKTAAEYADAFEQLGARAALMARREHSVASLRCTRATLEPALALLAEAVLEPALRTDDIARVRDLLVQQLGQRDDDPAAVASIVAPRQLFTPTHPLAWPLDGDASTVARLRDDDVRARATEILGAAGASVLVAGDVDVAEIADCVTRLLPGWPGTAAPPAAVAGPAAERPLEVFLVPRPGAVQTVIRFAWPIPARGPERHAIELLNAILGGSFTSRLNHSLRETHGYTYGAGSRVSQLKRAGMQSAASSVQASVTGAALREFLAQLDALAAGGVTADERDKAAATLRHRRIQGTAGLDGVLDVLEEALVLGESPDAFARGLLDLEAVTVGELEALAPRLMRHRHGVLVLVGDPGIVRSQVADLDLPAPVELDSRGGG